MEIKSIEVEGLLGTFDYRIDFLDDFDSVILIAPNGYGKTAFLQLIHDAVRLKVKSLRRKQFSRLVITFKDNSVWKFEKIWNVDDVDQRELFRGLTPENVRRAQMMVSAKLVGPNGSEADLLPEIQFDDIDTRRRIVRVVESHIPISRIGVDKFRDLRTAKTYNFSGLIEFYKEDLRNIPEFIEALGEKANNLLDIAIKPRDSVFVETQRLVHYTGDDEEAARTSPKEEILRQAASLASKLSNTLADYASRSQQLDRSFPSRLLDRARSGGGEYRNAEVLQRDLEAIDERRKLLIGSGILVEESPDFISTSGEFPASVLDALSIYVEDSKEKLAVFKDSYDKISTFKEILSRKFNKKSIYISKDLGIWVGVGRNLIELSQLSSGEKHEFIMLFKFIFETPANSLVLIDEPEISLHVAWQLEFMPDLARIQKANPFQAIIATHSPQIIRGQRAITIDLSKQYGG